MSSPVQRRLVVFALVLLLGVLAGWIFFRSQAPSQPGPTAAAPTVAPSSPATVSSATSSAGSDKWRAALEEARGLREPRARAGEFGRRLQEWIDRDPEAALAYVRSLGSGAEYTQGLLMVLTAIGRTDPDRALGLASELVSTREQRAIYSVLFAQMAANPAAAAARLARVPPGDSREYALRALADGWARADPPAALDWARNLTAEERAPAMEAVLATMQATDPLRAAELALQTLTGAALDRTLVAAVHTLTRTDPRAAAALVGSMPAGSAQTEAMFPVVRALAALNPGEALAWMKTLPAGPLQAMALNNILDLWVAQDPRAAGQSVAQMSPGPAQEAAAAHLAGLLARNPAEAIRWAQTLPHEETRHIAQVNLASAWAQHDPAAAAAWAAALSAPEVRTPALQGALSHWLTRDSDAVQNFVAGLTGETQLAAAAAVAPGLAQRDPVAAMAWTQTLLSGEARDAALAAAYARWLANAPAAAKAWLAGANLPPASKARLSGQPSSP